MFRIVQEFTAEGVRMYRPGERRQESTRVADFACQPECDVVSLAISTQRQAHRQMRRKAWQNWGVRNDQP